LFDRPYVNLGFWPTGACHEHAEDFQNATDKSYLQAHLGKCFDGTRNNDFSNECTANGLGKILKVFFTTLAKIIKYFACCAFWFKSNISKFNNNSNIKLYL